MGTMVGPADTDTVWPKTTRSTRLVGPCYHRLFKPNGRLVVVGDKHTRLNTASNDHYDKSVPADFLRVGNPGFYFLTFRVLSFIFDDNNGNIFLESHLSST